MNSIQVDETVANQATAEPVTANKQRLIDAGVPNVLPFSDISAADLPAVGGKGANLGEMARAGFPVPPGFCVATRAFWHFLQESGEADAVYAILDAVDLADLESVRQAGDEVRRRLSAAPVPADIADDVRTALGQADVDIAYAVRSSATAEDLPQASFAGQQDTYLNVRGVNELLDAVHRCWVSLFTDRAITYRIQNDFDHRDVALSVVVQRMVFPDVSGILFTADPVSGDRFVASIDASYGLGEALVSGLVSADLYKVDKRDLREIDALIADKQLAILPLSEGGTETVQLTEPQRSARVLTADQAVRLAEIGNRIEAHYGKPQDIEWALSNDEIFVVQSRPITSLYPLPSPRPDDDSLRVYFSFNHAQVMTDPMAPLGRDVWQLAIPFGRGSDPLAHNPYLPSAGGRLYIDLTSLLHNPVGRRMLPKMLAIADNLSAQAVTEVCDRSEFEERAPDNAAAAQGIVHWVAPIMGNVLADLWFRKPEGRTGEVDEWSDQYVEAARTRLLFADPGAPRLRMAETIVANVMGDAIRHLAHNIGGGFAAKNLLTKLAGDRANPEDLDNLLRGLPGNVTTEMDLRVGDLADIVREHPALAAHLNQGDLVAALAGIEDVAGGDEFRVAWNDYLAEYGMRGPSEIDISRARWNDDPSSLLQVVNGNQHQDVSGAHRLQHSALELEGLAAGERLAEAADHGLLGPLRARVARRMVRVSRNLLAVREHPKFLIIRVLGLARAEVVEGAKTLVARGQIESVDDVWYLTFDEIYDALEDADNQPDLQIARRRSDMARFRGMTPPRVITSDGEIPVVKHNRDDLPEGALPGMSVSAGVVEGLAKVITDPTTEIILPGEILVAPFTDPGWTPLFINASGLVMEVGGLMTHGSVVAREYGIPAVVGVLGATQLIETGQRIRVDGEQGYVEILDEN